MKNINKMIFISAAMGILLGILIKFYPNLFFVDYLLMATELVGQIFIKSLKMILVPLVFFSIIVGVSNLGGGGKSSLIWKSTFLYFMITMSIAITLALVVMNIVQPGVGLSIDSWQSINNNLPSTMTISQFFKQFLLSLFENPFHSLASGKILPLIVFSIIIGVALNDRKGSFKAAKDIFTSLYEVMLKIVHWLMLFAPLGVFALLVNMVASQDMSLFSQLGIFIFTVIFLILFHGLVILPTILFLITKITPINLWVQGRPAFITAFATSSSAATLPITLSVADNNFKTSKGISNFVLPLGATMNMDGTALYEAAAALFIANLVGMDLTLAQQLILFFTAMVASIGAPGIPSAGMVTMAMVLQVLGLPLEALAILLPMDRLIDTFRTTINVEGDLVGALIVDKITKS
ncbi:MAG: dicarboxylate/amino acid:cation symporter [Methylophilaceae bacterium]|jgi:Na+/H+-dicarboxylate symporter|nr:dicarboxylate/amino acid:cation symporter [Methylophilaceae bacterium]